jgi:photosystem II stability/assembly factor-like uncharacterized protein
MPVPLTLWIGTRKGAFVFRTKDRSAKHPAWKIEGPHFRGLEVHHVVPDPRDPRRVYAAVNNAWFGPHIHASEDGGKSWKLSETGLQLTGVTDAAGKPESIKRIWHIQPGPADQPGFVLSGVDPGALFRSQDWGQTWEQVSSLTLHPTRARWNPGAGGMCLHSIQCLGKGRIVVAISAAGAFRSLDGGETWEPYNQGVRADFMPDKFPEVGQCVHKLLAHPRDPEKLYQQNHCGVYRGKLAGKKWTDISKGLPTRFGFGLAVPAAEPDTLFTVPMEGAEYRCNLNGGLAVARSRDGGKTWKLLRKGLPQKNAPVTVLREAMTSDALSPAGVYFGTTGGTLYGTRDAGESWSALAENLPPIYSVAAA